jgi:hypothetical protein
MIEPKFKVGYYNIIVTKDLPWITNPETYTESVKGQMTANFAVNYRTKNRRYYTVTHLPTGYRIHTFDSFAHAKTFIKLAEAIPEIGTMNLDNSRSFAPKMKELIQQVLTNK